ncbi:TIGR02266 family protein [Archangium violaceum]|uniref:Hsp70 family protein n=1 Tax=Archangium violaceum TaxID=83451 RepID=UPI0019517D55|nr:Hsp70 family protein [Archangium violaceum]QRN99681.1 TIGR02266 family protein [Archangium violaceum]
MTVEPKLLPLRIRLPYATEEDFIEKYGSNVARGGLFIATRSPKPEGTGLAFELVLADGGRLLRGEGMVVKAQTEGARAGMTVRFVRLDAHSKALIDRILARRTETPPTSEKPRADEPQQAAPKRGRPVISAEALRKQAANPPRPAAPVAPKPAAPDATASRAAAPVPTPAAKPAAKPAIPATPSQNGAAPPKHPAPVPTRQAVPPAPKPAAPPPPAAVRPPAPIEQRAPVAPPEPPEALAPASVPVTASVVPTVAEVAAPAIPERPSPEASTRPTTQDLIANAILDHLAPEDLEPSLISPLESELPVSIAPAPTAPAPAEPSVVETPAPPVPTTAEPAVPPSAREEPVTETPAPSAPVTAEPIAPPAARETPAPTEPLPEELRRPPSPEFKGRRRAILDVAVSPPVTVTHPEVVLGIDLGTSGARVAVHHLGRLQLITLGETPSLPSLVAIDETGQLLVGTAARTEAERAPRHAAHGLRRFLGLRARSPLVRALGGPLPFSIVAGPRGDASIELRGQSHLLPELAARLLRELKSAAATFLGHEATRAVLCVPAHFDDRQRAAMREAGTLAGLNVLRILNAPSAAALAFGHERGLARKRILVVELGGGGLDVSVVQLTGDDLEVITTGGDPTVGGMDFDARIAEAIASDLQAQGVPRPEHPSDWSPLFTAAEAAKVALSEQEQVSVPLPGGLPPFSLDRERLEALTADLVQRITLVVRQVLESSALTPQGLDEVLLLGGQGRSPLVRRRLEESLGVPVRADVEATHSAALGAALLGQGILDAEAGKPGATVSEVLSVPIGVAERGGTLRRVLERNTRLPAEKTLVLPITPGPLVLALFQGPSPVAAENEYLGTLSFSIERPGEAEVHFSLSQDGTLSLAATLPGVKRHSVTLAADMPEDAELEAVISRSPLEGEPGNRPGGLLSGLRKLFGRR